MNRIYKAVGVALAAVLVSAALTGCFFGRFSAASVQFTTDSLELAVTDTVDLDDYVKSSSVRNDNVVYEVSEKSIAYLTGSLLRALRTGAVTVTASLGAKSDTIKVNIRYEPVSDIEISADRSLYMFEDEVKPVKLTAAVNAEANPDADIDWYVGGKAVSAAGRVFNYTPAAAAGTSVVTAKAGEAESSVEVNVYRRFELPSFYTAGALDQRDGPEKIVFGLGDFAPGNDPAVKVEWFVDGRLAYTARGGFKWDFTPGEAGEYNVTCLVNEIPVSFSGGGQAIVTVYGEKKLTDLAFEFDDDYPGLTLSWRPIGAETAYEVEVGGVIYGSKAYPELFTAGSFDATGKADLTADLTFTVHFLGAGIYSPTSASLNHGALKSEALKYLGKSWYGGNYYASDEDEFFELFSYAMVFRPGSTSTVYAGKQCSQLEYKVYMGYDSRFSAAALVSAAWEYAAQTGSYYLDGTGSSEAGGILKVKIVFASVNVPDNFSSRGKIRYSSLQMPHLGSGNGFTGLAIERLPQTEAVVSTSEELFYVVNAGLRPKIAEGSAADTLYSEAGYVLSQILDGDMSELETALSIFDYVMWQASYDYSVVDLNIEKAVRQPAFYLEGVLSTGFAVCDGLAKTYSLMCNMAGVRCVRVVGRAYTGDDMGDHAWNKVRIDGKWYIADSTWSDFRTSNLGGVSYEAASHQYFLLSDSEVASDHYEDDPSKYPATAAQPLYAVTRFNDAGQATKDMQTLFSALKSSGNTCSVLGKEYSFRYRTAEFSADFDTAEYLRADNYAAISRALSKAGVKYFDYDILDSNGTFIVLLK